MAKPKIAIVHDYLVQHGGAERSVEAIAQIFPEAPIYTAIYKPKKVGGIFSSRKVYTATKGANTLFNIFPIFAKYFTFLIPMFFENLNLDEYDIIISSSSGYAKGVLTKPRQLHIGYIHTPPRFLYGYSVESTKRNAWYYKPVVMIVDHFLRVWDFVAAQRPDFLVANSKTTRDRIRKFYGRDAIVINPPVEIDDTKIERNSLEPPYYYALGRLVAYKNYDLIIEVFNILGLPLKIIGTGPEEAKLKKIAKSNIKFLGRSNDLERNTVIENSLGYIFPVVEEDFGIVVVEALTHGKPVLAHRSGGPTEILREGKDGMFVDDLNLPNFVDKMREFDKAVRNKNFDPIDIKKNSAKYSKQRFQNELYEFVMQKWLEKKASL
ncbi:glycosyltransferase [candidate division WWE3 bacterium]|nr:glycosyltransferase [candidate division WWE3 bacterium]